jgi:hypothetical protein
MPVLDSLGSPVLLLFVGSGDGDDGDKAGKWTRLYGGDAAKGGARKVESGERTTRLLCLRSERPRKKVGSGRRRRNRR